MLKAKAVIPDKFWILESNSGERKGTLSYQLGHIRAVIDGSTTVYEDINKACWDLAINIHNDGEPEEEKKQEDVVSGYPTKCAAFNPIWDIKRKIPVFTKTEKSRTLHAAGYYIILFDTGWVQSFCPKVSTLDANDHKGPYKDKLEMREQLRIAQNASDLD
jgi:hypothetical protein